MKLIFLIGMPLSGKTYWAGKLSEAYRIPFADTDTLIRNLKGKTVAQIFETEGERVFRQLEHEVLKELVDTTRGPLIIACGGGMPVFYDNIHIMKKAGCTIYLKTNVVTLVQRLESIEEQNNRPLLAGIIDLEEELETLMEERKNIYEQADYTIDAANVSVSSFEQIIQSCIGRQ